VYAAHGRVELLQPTALEASDISATSYGGGLRIGGNVPGQLSNGSLTVEYGRATRSDGIDATDRVIVVTSFRF
jgi:hypothetical protein